MAEAKHTPGPWEVRKLNSGCVAGTIPVCTPDYGKALMSGTNVANVNGKAGEQEANARLIAAAPDLLTALIEVVRVNEAEATCPEWATAMLQAHAAIAKATGQPTVEEAGEKLGYSAQKIRDLCASGKLEHMRVGKRGHYRISFDACEDFLDRYTKARPSDRGKSQMAAFERILRQQRYGRA